MIVVWYSVIVFIHISDYSDEREELPLGPNFQELVLYFRQ